ncbi:hypothetical protein AAAV91_08955, partial [Ligilactobacillus ruminis]|uniref:hypothetical protein n=1 Tax=Ligilactobacillus ruminis TaxID=1623 RepID=UPI0032C0F4F7
MATFFNILLLALIVATIGNLISNFKGKKQDFRSMRCFRSSVCFFGSLSNGIDDLENFTSEMEWSFFVPVGFSCVFS